MQSFDFLLLKHAIEHTLDTVDIFCSVCIHFETSHFLQLPHNINEKPFISAAMTGYFHPLYAINIRVNKTT